MPVPARQGLALRDTEADMPIDRSGLFFYPPDARPGAQYPSLVASGVNFGGINNQFDPQFIRDEEAVLLRNTDLDTPGIMKKRQGFKRAMLPATGVTYPIIGIYDFKPDDGNTQHVVTLSGGKIRYTTDANTSATPPLWTIGTGTTFTINDESDDVFMVQASNQLFIFNRGDPPRIFAHSGTNRLTAVPSSATDVPFGTSAEFMNQRLFVAGGEPFPNYVGYSDPILTTQFDFANNVKFDIGRDGRIVAIKKRRNNEMVVFLDNAIEVLQEDYADDSILDFDITSWYRTVIEPNIGCGARDTVQMFGQDIFFLDDRGFVRRLSRTITDEQRGVFSQPVSDKITKFIPDDVNKNKMRLAQAIVHDNKYFIATPSKLSLYNDVVDVYDFRYNAWTGHWTGLSVAKFVRSDINSASEEELLYFAGSNDQGTESHQFYQLLYGGFQDNAPNNGNDSSGSPISLKIVSKAFDFGAPASEKIWHWLEVEANGDVGGSFSISMSIDEGDPVSIGTMSLLGANPPQLDDDFINLGPPQLPVTLVDQPRVRKRFHLESKLRGIRAQLVFENNDEDCECSLVAYRFGALVENVELEF